MAHIHDFKELKTLTIDELNQLSETIRNFLIQNVSKTGGHIGANLSVIELTIALHYVFDSPNDKIIFDTGHQGYTHKILTGRTNLFPTLNKFKGLNRFLTRKESEHDIMDATHAGTSLSTASGIAKSFKLNNSPNHVIAIIGDGTLVEGLSFEGLNFLASENLKSIIVINDNEMAIAPNVGGIKNLTQGPNWEKKCQYFFEGLGFEYISVPNGHNIPELISSLQTAKGMNKSVIVHVKTEKGKGLPFAKNHPYKMHFSFPFDPKTGDGASPTISGKTYAVIASEVLYDILKKDPDVVVITPATPYASSLEHCMKDFPERVFDVGMAEQHAVSMACGLALTGKKPVVCFQTTFMQRAFDQILHDACFMNLPITVLGVRSGFAGYDGPTHHGLYDVPYLRSFPNMQLNYPCDSNDLKKMITERLLAPKGPMTILFPYESIPNPEPVVGTQNDGMSVFNQGKDIVIVCLGNQLESAHKIRDKLLNAYQIDLTIICIQKIKPLSKNKLLENCSSKKVIVIEESTMIGGIGSLICETLVEKSANSDILCLGVPDIFVPAGNKIECSEMCELLPQQIIPKILKRWPDLLS